jgi:hypothetical protein
MTVGLGEGKKMVERLHDHPWPYAFSATLQAHLKAAVDA